jgi:hypothetical protein
VAGVGSRITFAYADVPKTCSLCARKSLDFHKCKYLYKHVRESHGFESPQPNAL